MASVFLTPLDTLRLFPQIPGAMELFAVMQGAMHENRWQLFTGGHPAIRRITQTAAIALMPAEDPTQDDRPREWDSKEAKFKWAMGEKMRAHGAAAIAGTDLRVTQPAPISLEKAVKILHKHLPHIYALFDDLQTLLIKRGLLHMRVIPENLLTLFTIKEVIDLSCIALFLVLFLREQELERAHVDTLPCIRCLLIITRMQTYGEERQIVMRDLYKRCRIWSQDLGETTARSTEQAIRALLVLDPLFESHSLSNPFFPFHDFYKLLKTDPAIKASAKQEDILFLLSITNILREISADPTDILAKYLLRNEKAYREEDNKWLGVRIKPYLLKVLKANFRLMNQVRIARDHLSTQARNLHEGLTRILSSRPDDAYRTYLRLLPLIRQMDALKLEVEKFPAYIEKIRYLMVWLVLMENAKCTLEARPILKKFFIQLQVARRTFYHRFKVEIEVILNRIPGFLSTPVRADHLQPFILMFAIESKLKTLTNSTEIQRGREVLEKLKRELTHVVQNKDLLTQCTDAFHRLARELIHSNYSTNKELLQKSLPLEEDCHADLSQAAQDEYMSIFRCFQIFVQEVESKSNWEGVTWRFLIDFLDRIIKQFDGTGVSETLFEQFLADKSSVEDFAGRTSPDFAKVIKIGADKEAEALSELMSQLQFQHDFLWMLSNNLFSLIAKTSNALVGDGRVDELEYSFPESMLEALSEPSTAQPSTGLSVKRTGHKKRKGRGQAAAAAKKPMTRMALPKFVTTAAAAVAKREELTGAVAIARREGPTAGSLFKGIYHRLLSAQDLGHEILPAAFVGAKEGDPRFLQALCDRRLAFYALDTMFDMLQSNILFCPQGALTRAGRVVMGFFGLQAHLCLERGVLAEILKKEILCPLPHDLRYLYEQIGHNTEAHPFVAECGFGLLRYRYPNDLNEQLLSLAGWPMLMTDFVAILRKQLSEEGIKLDGEMKETPLTEVAFGKRKHVPGALPATMATDLLGLEARLQEQILALKGHLNEIVDGEKRKIMIPIIHHLNILRQIPTLLCHFPHQKYLLIPVMMLFISGKYLCENIGLYRHLLNGKRDVVRMMGEDLHRLRAYCKPVADDKGDKAVYLDTPLVPASTLANTLQILDITKPEYIYRAEGAHLFTRLVSEAFGWSLAVSDGGIWAHSSKAKGGGSTEEMFAQFQKQLGDTIIGVGQLAHLLVNFHVLNRPLA